MKKKKNHSHKRGASSKSRNELYRIKEQQKILRRREEELKFEIMKTMYDTQVHEDAEGKIEKVSRKSKRSYDRELLETRLKKYGLSEKDIKDIIEATTRQINVSQHLSVTPKHKKR